MLSIDAVPDAIATGVDELFPVGIVRVYVIEFVIVTSAVTLVTTFVLSLVYMYKDLTPEILNFPSPLPDI
jgi:hypothetical protein